MYVNVLMDGLELIVKLTLMTVLQILVKTMEVVL